MSIMTGRNLLESIIQSTGVEVNTLVSATLSAKLQQMIDNGTYSKLAASIAMSAFSTAIKDAAGIGALSDAVETNAALIEAAAEGEVDQIEFPSIVNDDDGTHETTTCSVDVGSVLENDKHYFDAAEGSFVFTDDASVATFVEISNFTVDDQIQISNLPAEGSYMFSSDGNDVDITYNYVDEGVVNYIKLIGVGNDDVFDDETGFENAIGFNAIVFA